MSLSLVQLSKALKGIAEALLRDTTIGFWAQEYDVIVTQGLSGMAVADYAARVDRPVARFIAGAHAVLVPLCLPRRPHALHA